MHQGKSIESSEKSRSADLLTSQTVQAPDNALSLHISPCGDWWLGTEIYAAKHNPSGYVRSIKLPDGFDEHDHLLDGLPESTFKTMYDTGFLDVCISVPKFAEDEDMRAKTTPPSEIG
jgi:hypothetical protein